MCSLLLPHPDRYGLETPPEYHAADCRVTLSHLEITCWTVAGAGTGLLWTVVIDGQESRLTTTDYAPPSITRFEGPAAVDGNTDGGQVRCTPFRRRNARCTVVCVCLFVAL